MNMQFDEIKSGSLLKKESKEKEKWKEHFFVLSGSNLFWYKATQKDPKKRGKPKGSISLLGSMVKEGDVTTDKSQPYAFHINRGNELIVLAANSQDEARDWTDLLKSTATGGKDSRETVQIQEELRRIGHEIKEQDLQFGDEQDWVIGVGASGIVKRGLWLKTTEVAVKALKNLPEFTENKELISFYKEIETLSKLRHANIVQMYGFCKKQNYICLVTEFVKGGSLQSCLGDRENYPLDLPLQIELTANISRGMVYLHSQGIFHRDLKPANILIENWFEGRVKVCDFGLSRVRKKDQDDAQESALGSPQYAAPELNKDTHNEKVDVFSFAIILWEVSARTQPWPEVRFGWEFSERYGKGQRPPVARENPFKNLITKCWNQDPDLRPSFVEIFEELENLKKSLGITGPPSPHMTGRTFSSASIVPPKTIGIPLPGLKASISPPPLRPSQMTPKSSGVEGQVTKIFSGKQAETWIKFSGALGSALNTSQQVMNKIQFIFENNGMVEKSTWESFLVWFSPLAAPNLYQTNDVAPDGYDLDDILNTCTPSWFHGFLSSADAQRSLKGKPDGTFLFRFSTSNPGSYALSAAYSGTVGHWRISCARAPGSRPVFKIDNREYTSLSHIVDSHKAGDPLKIKDPKPGQADSCFLSIPFVRVGSEVEYSDSFYQNVKR